MSDAYHCICGKHFDDDTEDCGLERARRSMRQSDERSGARTIGRTHREAGAFLAFAFGPQPIGDA